MFDKLIKMIKSFFKVRKTKKFKFKPSSVRYVTFSSSGIKVDLKRYFNSEHGKNALKKFRQTNIKELVDKQS